MHTAHPLHGVPVPPVLLLGAAPLGSHPLQLCLQLLSLFCIAGPEGGQAGQFLQQAVVLLVLQGRGTGSDVCCPHGHIFRQTHGNSQAGSVSVGSAQSGLRDNPGAVD